MKALTWQASNTVTVEEVRDPQIQEPTDAVIRVTSTAICGSDLHLYGVLAPFMDEGDIIDHGPMGIVEGVGSAVTHIKPGDRVVIPFNVSCEHCFMCRQGLQSQCETTQVREYGTGAQFLGYSRLYGSPLRPIVASALRSRAFTPSVAPLKADAPDERLFRHHVTAHATRHGHTIMLRRHL